MNFSLESINFNEDTIYVNNAPNKIKSSHQNVTYPPDMTRRKARTNTITFYLPLIIALFDNVKILWSKGPAQTAKLFSMLKQGQLEPNV